MIPNPDQISWALRKVAADFGRLPGVLRVRAVSYGGKPAILVEGHQGNRPAIPRFIQVFADGGRYPLPILWRSAQSQQAQIPLPASTAEEDIRLDEAMWAGAPTVTPRPVKMWEPGESPDTPIARDVPTAAPADRQMALSVRLPQFAVPNFWAKPFYDTGNICCPRYATRSLAYRYQVPSDYMLVITGISYEFSNLVPFDQFNIHVLRDENQLSEFTDMRALNTGDPATEYVFGGHYRPFPYYGRFDHDQTLGIAVTVLGPYPFTRTDADTLGGCVSVFPSGWLGSLYDNRDGGARPVDMGELNDIALGEATVAPVAGPARYDRELRYARPGQWQPRS